MIIQTAPVRALQQWWDMCVMRAHTQAQAEHHTDARTHAAVRLSERSAAEKEGDAEESSSPTDPQARERQRLEQELGGEITAVLKKYFIAELQQFVGNATSIV